MSTTVVGPPSTLIAQSRRCVSTSTLMPLLLIVVTENRNRAVDLECCQSEAVHGQVPGRMAMTSTSTRMLGRISAGITANMNAGSCLITDGRTGTRAPECVLDVAPRLGGFFGSARRVDDLRAGRYPHGIGVVADMGGYAGADGLELAAHVALSSSCSVWQKDERRGRPADSRCNRGHTGPTVRPA